MAKRVAKCTIGIQDNNKNTYRETPFRIAYWNEAVIPAEIRLTSFIVENHDESRNDEAIRLQLDLVDEVRATVEQRLA